jgi:hypothetical protein
MIPLMDKVRYVGYGAIGGLVIGAIMGWMFHGWVGFLVRLGFLILLLIPLVFAIYFWKRVTTKTPAPAYVPEANVPARRARMEPTAVREAEWIELETPPRTRR